MVTLLHCFRCLTNLSSEVEQQTVYDGVGFKDTLVGHQHHHSTLRSPAWRSSVGGVADAEGDHSFKGASQLLEHHRVWLLCPFHKLSQ